MYIQNVKYIIESFQSKKCRTSIMALYSKLQGFFWRSQKSCALSTLPKRKKVADFSIAFPFLSNQNGLPSLEEKN